MFQLGWILNMPSFPAAALAKLVAQKSKGMPLISISLVKLVDSAASEAIGNLSLQLLTALKNTKNLLREGYLLSFSSNCSPSTLKFLLGFEILF